MCIHLLRRITQPLPPPRTSPHRRRTRMVSSAATGEEAGAGAETGQGVGWVGRAMSDMGAVRLGRFVMRAPPEHQHNPLPLMTVFLLSSAGQIIS
jgi:hypothetical protein